MPELSAELIDRRFAQTEPRGNLRLAGFGLLIFLALVGVSAVLSREGEDALTPSLFLLLPWGLVFLAAVIGWRMNRHQSRSHFAVTKAWEHFQLDEWDRGREVLDEAMQVPIHSQSIRTQAFMLLATLAEKEKRYDCAARIYRKLLETLRIDGVRAQQAQVFLARALLREQELTDAVNLLSRIETSHLPDSLKAVHCVVRLYQQVYMGHLEDAVEDIEEKRALMQRHLSTQAACGYALLAAALHQLGRRSEASNLWSEATTLMDAGKLVGEYDLLETVAATYQSTEHRI